MPDETSVHIGENSPEQVAYKLMQDISTVEDRRLYQGADNPADRAWTLKTYEQCISVVRGKAAEDAIKQHDL